VQPKRILNQFIHRTAISHEMALQTARKVFEIMQAFAQKSVVHAHDARAQFVLHAFDAASAVRPLRTASRSFCRQP